MHAKTIPLQLGTQIAGIVVLATLGVTVIVSAFLPLVSPLKLGIPYIIASIAAGIYLLLIPGYRLFSKQEGRGAAALFDKASYYPLAQLAIITIFVLLQ